MQPFMWMFGGGDRANDIGHGGIDHVLVGGHGAKIRAPDPKVYSDAGGQSSEATPMGRGHAPRV